MPGPSTRGSSRVTAAMPQGEPGPLGHPPSPEAPREEPFLGEPWWEHLPVASVDALEEGAEQTHGNWQPAQ